MLAKQKSVQKAGKDIPPSPGRTPEPPPDNVVSKRVAVRFDWVDAQGRISEHAAA